MMLPNEINVDIETTKHSKTTINIPTTKILDTILKKYEIQGSLVIDRAIHPLDSGFTCDECGKTQLTTYTDIGLFEPDDGRCRVFNHPKLSLRFCPKCLPVEEK